MSPAGCGVSLWKTAARGRQSGPSVSAGSGRGSGWGRRGICGAGPWGQQASGSRAPSLGSPALRPPARGAARRRQGSRRKLRAVRGGLASGPLRPPLAFPAPPSPPPSSSPGTLSLLEALNSAWLLPEGDPLGDRSLPSFWHEMHPGAARGDGVVETSTPRSRPGTVISGFSSPAGAPLLLKPRAVQRADQVFAGCPRPAQHTRSPPGSLLQEGQQHGPPPPDLPFSPRPWGWILVLLCLSKAVPRLFPAVSVLTFQPQNRKDRTGGLCAAPNNPGASHHTDCAQPVPPVLPLLF